MYKLIIADDDSNFLEQFYELVDWEKNGFEVKAKLYDGADIIEYIKENEADAIITDIKMPEKSGIDVAKYIYENHLDIKVVFFSAYRSFDYAVEAVSYDVVGYITKPLRFSQLNEVLEKLKTRLSKRDYANKFIDDNVIKARKKAMDEYFLGDGAEPDINEALMPLSSGMLTSGITEFTVADFEEYSQKIWKYGEKQLYDAFMRIMCYETEEYYSVPLAFWGGEALVLIIAKNLDMDIEKAVGEISGRIKDCFKLDCIIKGFCGKDNLKELKSDMLREERGFLKDAKQFLERAVESERTEKYIRRIKSYIDENFSNDISRKDIASVLYVSESSLDRLFSKHMGCRFVEYLNYVRVEKAKILMEDDSIPMSELHNYLGYKSKAHFFKLFKQFTGGTPLEYRKKHIKRDI